MLNMTRPLMYNPTLILAEGGGGRPVRAHAGVSTGNASILGSTHKYLVNIYTRN